MNELNPHNDHLTADDLQKYRTGALSVAERHRVERLLLENPLYADALDGLEMGDQQNIELNRIQGELRTRFQARVQNKKSRRLPIWLPALAASVVLALSIGLYLRLQQTTPRQPVQPPLAPNVALNETAPAVESSPMQQPVPRSPQITTRKPSPTTQKTVEARDSLSLPEKDWLANAPEPSTLNPLEPSLPITLAPESNQKQVLTAIEAAPSRAVDGQIVDENNQPLPGVSVIASQSRQQTTTDTAGRFHLARLSPNDSLQLFSVGHRTASVHLEEVYRTEVIHLKSDSTTLSEVVAVEYGKRPRRTAPAFGAKARFLPLSVVKPPANFKTYLDQNRRIPAEAKEKGITGTVRVRFRVDSDGSASQFSIVKSLGFGCDEEAIRLIQKGPRWQPAIRNGKPYAQFIEQEIVF
ncbi:carboxypeptidase-like regulatory domain-containing protein [Larkinella harenae]